ncbi:MAG: hypothetical protein HYY02_02715 [Chloroflexi bacterium]|nr:hypothetical protein [Chloroflexota bacterium]
MTARSSPIIIAHRGASGYAPENTVASFDKALELGFPDIEFDIRASKDGIAVVIHDATVDRTTSAGTVLSASGPHPVQSLMLAELKALDAGAWFGPDFAGQRLPTLEELFDRYRERARFWVEVKEAGRGLEVKLAALMARHGLRERCAALSFEPVVIQELAHVARGRFPVGLLVVRLDEEAIEQAAHLGADGIYPFIASLTPELAQAVRARGLRLGTAGVETEEQVALALRCGVDGFVHNYPDVARAQVQRLRGDASPDK